MKFSLNNFIFLGRGKKYNCNLIVGQMCVQALKEKTKEHSSCCMWSFMDINTYKQTNQGLSGINFRFIIISFWFKYQPKCSKVLRLFPPKCIIKKEITESDCYHVSLERTHSTLHLNWVSWKYEIATLSGRLDQMIHCVPFQPLCYSVISMPAQFFCVLHSCSWRNSSHTWLQLSCSWSFFSCTRRVLRVLLTEQLKCQYLTKSWQ